MKKILEIIIRLVLSCIGIILVGGLPSLLTGLDTGTLDWESYWKSLKVILNGMLHIQQLTYFHNGKMLPMFPNIINPIIYSLLVLFSAFILASLISLILSVFTVMLPFRLRRGVKFLFFMLEAIPDLFIIALCQLMVIFILQKTGYLIADIAAIDKEQIYLFPIFCLSILPTIQLFRICMIILEEEIGKDYVLLARSIGIRKSLIMFVYVLRNAWISLLFQSKKTIWFMLSNLFVLEYLFHMQGITMFMVENMDPKIFTLALLALFVPIFILYSIGEWILQRKITGGESIT
ncbi:MAG: ABC transporter permease subunit [Heyndrickxia sp.]